MQDIELYRQLLGLTAPRAETPDDLTAKRQGRGVCAGHPRGDRRRCAWGGAGGGK